MAEFEPVIGLEVHAELLTQSKMFCGCRVVDSTQAEPNSSVCEICTGMPGTLPVINRRAVEYALKVALALNCQVSNLSVFARKNYFYPDLPKGFQISQYEMPLATDGWLTLNINGSAKKIRIRRVHLEEDTGKLFHRDDHSLIDYNRSGVPLLEIVSEPDLQSVEEVKAYATVLRSVLRYLEVNSGDMEKGVIRFEANVSIRPESSSDLGIRTEIKNLNSFRAMVKAIEYEVNRQTKLLEQGKPVRQETVGWDEGKGRTFSQRGKEEAHDYRYFPEPDLPPLEIDPAWIEEIKESLPELPNAKRTRFENDYQLSNYTASVLTAEREIADFFEASVSAAPDVSPEKLANWLTGPLFAKLNQLTLSIQDVPTLPKHFAELVAMVERDEINAASGKIALNKMIQTGKPPQNIVEELNLRQVSDPETIQSLVQSVLDANPEQVQQYLQGKDAIAQWLIGQVMREGGGKTNPSEVQKALEKALRSIDENHPSA